jgi:pimeloyl-ACP methyl ester carboxylesterase
MRGFALLVLLVSGACAQHRVGHDSLARESNRESPLHVVTVGSGPVTTVVLHGGPGARHNYLRPEWDQLQDIGRVVYYDQRGCGKSVREGPHSWKQHVQDLHNLLTALEPSGPIVLAGSSWGSNLALLYAYTYPDHVSALVLSGLVVWFSGEREWMKHLTPGSAGPGRARERSGHEHGGMGFGDDRSHQHISGSTACQAVGRDVLGECHCA